MNIYEYTVPDDKNNEVSLKKYEGKVVLIVNTATHCGFTPTYKNLEALYEKYHEKGLEILDFPCNQFASQAPEEIEEINRICSLNYGTKFTRFNKIDVNGANRIPLYAYLEKTQGFKGFDKEHKLTPVLTKINKKENPNWDKDPSIKWNFTKFLINKKGEAIARFEPTASFDKLDKAIEEELKK